jgi:hypothetical protein
MPMAVCTNCVAPSARGFLCGGREQGIGTGDDDRFAGFARAGAGDDLCVVSSQGGRIEFGYGAVFDFCVCTGGSFARERKNVNIILYHLLLNPAAAQLAVLVTILWFFLFYRYRGNFSGLFVQKAA